MSQQGLFTYQRIIHDLSEGVLTLDLRGTITGANPAALALLNMDKHIVGRSFVQVFFQQEGNDDFIQTIIDAVYENDIPHVAMVDYNTGQTRKKLMVNASFLKNAGEKIGVAAVLNDFTELEELRDAVLAMERIAALNQQLEARNLFIKKTFGRYLSDEIVHSILDSDSGLDIGGQKRYVSILFSDLRDFTSTSEQMPPQELIAMLNAYLARMIAVIAAHRGTILEFIGDAIVAVFGAPAESDSHEYDAVCCAIEMQRGMEQVNRHNGEQGWPLLTMGIGVHCGEVVMGNIGSEQKAKYDMIGRNVNLASRIETCSKGGQVLVSAEICQRLGQSLQLSGSFRTQLKGISREIEIYQAAALDGHILPQAQE